MPYTDYLLMVEAEGHDPSQSYLYAGELQSLELASAQHLQREALGCFRVAILDTLW